MAEKDRSKVWLAFSTTTEIAMAITLNKYSASLPNWAVLLIWLIPLIFFVTWVVSEERSKAFFRHLKATPVSYSLMLVVFLATLFFGTQIVKNKLFEPKPDAIATQLIKQKSQPPQVAPASPMTTKPPPKPRTKVEEVLPPVDTLPPAAVGLQQSPTYQQQCVGSACAQGPNSQATYNQYGPSKLVLSDSEQASITEAMRPFKGIKVFIFNNGGTSDSMTFASRLAESLRDAGIDCPNPPLIGGDPVFPSVPGVSIRVGVDRISAGKGLYEILNRLKIVTQVSSFVPTDDNKEGFEIQVMPNEVKP